MRVVTGGAGLDDCVEGLIRLMAAEYCDALNFGSDYLVTINGLVDLVCNIAGKRLSKQHHLSEPQGVRGRNSDNRRLRDVLGWEPSFILEHGLAVTYPWIEKELESAWRIQKLVFAQG